MKKPVLVILAAGIGSRYGGMKQIDGVGNHGEPIIEFSIYDAYRAGFEKVVLIIKKEHEAVFRSCLTDRVERHMEVGFAYQDMNDLPEGISVPSDRTKPWGTTHALWACRDIVDGPFAIINADDFYGRNAYKTIYDYLCNEIEDDKYAMVGWQCRNTLTDHGTVTRGVCQTSPEGYLTDIVEIKEIAKKDGKCIAIKDGTPQELPDDALVSMNFWGFTPKIFEEVEPIMADYLKTNIPVNPLKCEHVIPTAVGDLVEAGKCSVKVLSSADDWFGVTYQEDKPEVVRRIQALKDAGIYPDIVWE